MVVIHEVSVCVRIEVGNIYFYIPRGVCLWEKGRRLIDEGDVARACNSSRVSIIHAEGRLVAVISDDNTLPSFSLRLCSVPFNVHETSRPDDPQV